MLSDDLRQRIGREVAFATQYELSVGGVLIELRAAYDALAAEVAALKADAKLGKAVRKLPPNSALAHDAVTPSDTHPFMVHRDAWSVVYTSRTTGDKDTPDAALAAAGLMEVGNGE